MKIIRTVLVSLSILISLFFVVYANIQTNLAKEKEQEANNLRYEAVMLQKMAEEQAVKSKEQIQQLEAELVECKGSEE